MLPAQRNKVDISKLTPDEQKAFRLYGKLPARNVANKAQERKYFDSGDWALSRSGKAEHANVSLGKSMPKPDEIPHASPTPGGAGGPAASSSPPAGTPLSPTSGGSPGSIPLGINNNVPNGIPTPGSGVGSSGLAGPSSTESGINLSMSPGRVGVGQPLATSPTRSFNTFGERVSPTNSTGTNPLVARLEGAAESASKSGGLPGLSHQNSGTTGNHIGRTQMRRTSQSEGLPSAGNSGSGLSQSVSAEDDQVAEMELQ